MPANPVIARAALHFWEEPVISGEKGSGAVFFSGCNLHCVYCQNSNISGCSANEGKSIPVSRLREIYFELIRQGACNINLVTPMHYTDAILESLQQPLPCPVVWNSNGYESVNSLRRCEGKINIYLPDLKYSSNEIALRYSHAGDYFETAVSAIDEMFRQTGPYRIGDDGLLKQGVVIRHLILPGHADNSKRVIDYVASHFAPGEVLFSLMRQYIPCGKVSKDQYSEINRKVSDEEYAEVEDHLFASGIEDGFVQDKESAENCFIPDFDETGV